VIYPIGIPLQYAILLFRNRNALRELRHVEMIIEADFALAKLDAEVVDGEEQVALRRRQAEDAHDQRRKEYNRRRAKLPTTLKKLTAGYELRCYWFEIFECGRKIALVCLPVFFSPGSAGQLILGLVICFLTYGMYCSFAPYEEPADDVLASMAQLSIFFSLVASIVTSAYPDDPLMSALLPLFLAVPISLMVLFEVELLDKMKALTQPDDNGNVPRIGRAVLYVRNMATKTIDEPALTATSRSLPSIRANTASGSSASTTVDNDMGVAQVAQATQDPQAASENDGSEERRAVAAGGLSGTEVVQVLAVQMKEKGEDEDDATPSRVEKLDPQKKRPSCAALTADRQESDGKVSLGGYGSNYGSELDLAGMEAGHKAPVGTDGAAGIGLSRAAADNVDCTADSHVSSSTREQPPTNNGATDESPGASRWSSVLAI